MRMTLLENVFLFLPFLVIAFAALYHKDDNG